VTISDILFLTPVGAPHVFRPPVKSPSLSGYPACDEQVQTLAKDLWGSMDVPQMATNRSYGKGVIHWGGALSSVSQPPLYPSYDLTSALLKGMGVKEDFSATGPVRYGHRRTADRDIYFVSNCTGDPIKADCCFRVAAGNPELWNPVTGERRPLLQFERKEGTTTIPMEFDAFQSYFVVFSGKGHAPALANGKNFPELMPVQEISGSWEVAFDPKWGGPEKVTFDTLQDWTKRSESGIKYYSGIATYRNSFQVSELPKGTAYLNLGTVQDMARVKLNGKDLGVVWCAPWRIEVTGAIKAGNNQLEIEVVNRWPNRMIGDKQPADANLRRYTFSTHDPYNAQSALVPSGLLGPVRVVERTPN
jgi:hypothetical protein